MSNAGRYTVVRKLADGGMASLYLGIQRGAAGFERPVVIKAMRAELSTDEHFRNALVDEAHIAMSLRHSNIAQVLDLGIHGGRTFLILELVDGWDLDQVLRRAEAAKLALPTNLALHLTAEVLRALAYAHAKTRAGAPLKIVHRDVSPHNVLVSEQGEVKLTDFGIATAAAKREQTIPGLIKGKVGFMSPEQADGAPLDARSDLFAVGAMLYELCTGRRPFAAPTELEALLRTREARFEPPDEVNPKLELDVANLITRAMKRDPDDRFATAEEMLERTEQVLRKSFEPAGPTELKGWLAELSRLDGQMPPTRLSVPPLEIGDDAIIASRDIELSEVGPPQPPPPPRKLEPTLVIDRWPHHSRATLAGALVVLATMFGVLLWPARTDRPERHERVRALLTSARTHVVTFVSARLGGEPDAGP